MNLTVEYAIVMVLKCEAHCSSFRVNTQYLVGTLFGCVR